MNKNLNTSSMTEAAIVSAFLVILALFSTYAFQLLDFLFPVPIILLASRRDFKYATLSAVTATILILLIIGIQLSIMYICIYTPLAIVIAYFVNKDKNPSVCIFSGTVVVIVTSVVALQICKLFFGVEVVKEFDIMISQFFEINKKIVTSMNFSNVQGQSIDKMLNLFTNLVKQLVPTFIILSAVALTVVNYMIACLVSRKFKVKIKPMKDIMFFRLPKNFMLGVVLMLIITVIVSKLSTTSYEVVTINLTFLISLCFLLQGLAVIKFYLVKKKVNAFLRFVIIIAVILIQYLSILAMCIGVGDYILNLRRLNTIK